MTGLTEDPASLARDNIIHRVQTSLYTVTKGGYTLMRPGKKCVRVALGVPRLKNGFGWAVSGCTKYTGHAGQVQRKIQMSSLAI